MDPRPPKSPCFSEFTAGRKPVPSDAARCPPFLPQCVVMSGLLVLTATTPPERTRCPREGGAPGQPGTSRPEAPRDFKVLGCDARVCVCTRACVRDVVR